MRFWVYVAIALLFIALAATVVDQHVVINSLREQTQDMQASAYKAKAEIDQLKAERDDTQTTLIRCGMLNHQYQLMFGSPSLKNKH